MLKSPVAKFVVVASVVAFAACKPAGKKSSSPGTPGPNIDASIAPVGVSGSEIQVASTAFPARIQFRISGANDPAAFSLALAERPANVTIEGRNTLQPVLLWTPTASQPQAYVQFVMRDVKRCAATTGNQASCSLSDGQVSPSSPLQPYDKLSTRYLLRFTGDTRSLQGGNSNAVIPGTQVLPAPNGGSTLFNQLGTQILQAGGRVGAQIIQNNFSTSGLNWNQILQQAFGLPTNQTTTPPSTGTNGTPPTN